MEVEGMTYFNDFEQLLGTINATDKESVEKLY